MPTATGSKPSLESLDVDPDALAAVAALAVMPLLQALRRRFGPRGRSALA